MTRPVVLLTNPIDPPARERLAQHAEVALAAADDPGSLRAALNEHRPHALIVRAMLPPDLCELAPQLLAAVRHGAGVDLIPVAAATAAGVIVANVPGANAATVAEYAIAQMLRHARGLERIEAGLRGPGWAAVRGQADAGRELAGATLGIVGMGAIGAHLARIARHGFGMRVLGHRRSDAPMPEGVEPAGLDALLAASQWVVLACPLTDQTRGLIDARRLALMPAGAVLVNVSRGAVVDEPALIAALRAGTLGGAVLDVFAAQPLAADSPLRTLPGVLLSPHVAGISADSMRRMSAAAVDQVIAVLRGHPPAHFINPEVWPSRRANPFAEASQS
jgi:D-3-phosphoglycerate dehydrogenase